MIANLERQATRWHLTAWSRLRATLRPMSPSSRYLPSFSCCDLAGHLLAQLSATQVVPFTCFCCPFGRITKSEAWQLCLAWHLFRTDALCVGFKVSNLEIMLARSHAEDFAGGQRWAWSFEDSRWSASGARSAPGHACHAGHRFRPGTVSCPFMVESWWFTGPNNRRTAKCRLWLFWNLTETFHDRRTATWVNFESCCHILYQA